MQIQWVIDLSIREYIAKGRDLQVDRKRIPPCCSNSQRHRHGFYSRHCPEYGELLILRFLCIKCRCTTSLLPTFLTPLKWHSSDAICIALLLLIIMKKTLLSISFKRGFSPSTLSRWRSQFLYNSANFQLEEYQQRLGKCFPFKGIELFQVLLDFFLQKLTDSDEATQNFFIPLQQSLACPFLHNGQFLPSLGIFRTVLDRGS